MTRESLEKVNYSASYRRGVVDAVPSRGVKWQGREQRKRGLNCGLNLGKDVEE